MKPDDTQELRIDPTQELPRTIAVRHTRRVVVGVVGGVVLAAGVVLSIPGVPLPGFLVVLIGLTILSWEFPWARRLLHRARTKLKELRLRRHAG